jgi:CheY-like chemotaxis protein
MMNRAREVLIVEDDEDARELLSIIVASMGYAAIATDSAVQGLELLQVSKRRDPAQPCAVLLDLMMPGVSGDTLGRQIAEHPALGKVPIIVVSGAHDYQQRAAAIGAVAALSKPIDWGRLEQILRTVC